MKKTRTHTQSQTENMNVHRGKFIILQKKKKSTSTKQKQTEWCNKSMPTNSEIVAEYTLTVSSGLQLSNRAHIIHSQRKHEKCVFTSENHQN